MFDTDDTPKQKREKPLLFGKESSAQDEVLVRLEAGEFDDTIKPFYDASSVPGHAELTLANDMDEGDLPEHVKESYYKRFGTGPKPLPAELRWVRTHGPDGGRSHNADVAKMRDLREGYRPATVDDLRRAGYGNPITGQVLPDGTIRREDTTLFIVDGERARQLDAEKRRAAREADATNRKAAHPGDVWLAEEERRREDPYERLRTQNS